ncbi:MAG: serine hydrolase [Kordiimonadaceae bacterium]|jgi:CubicO group peptidase (beta-lactamase class C family)|nr:serine hydrolase [Kordiimonadaceae bacterium]MBT6035430.1 serine hydrolase [Kordiimonadaceae bacterium]MBT6328935.1 serine hydrolase [Kordiimonadaceae bacterium]
MTNWLSSKILNIGVASLIAFSIASCGDTSAPIDQTNETIWPGEAWEVSTPEAEGVDPKIIESIVEELRAGIYGSVDQFLFIKNGKAIADFEFSVDYDAILAEDGDNHSHLNAGEGDHQYNYDHTSWHPYYQDTKLHTMQSVTKSVTSAALGIAIDEGLIEGVHVPVSQFFTDYHYDLTDPRKSEATLEDFLTMRSGIEWATEGGYGRSEHSTVLLEKSDQWIQFTLDQPMDNDPGTVYEYNDGASVLIGKIARQATGKRMDQWAKERLFDPIGIKDFYWKTTPDGETDTEGGLYLTTHDLARFGYLFLKKGQWNGKQIISEEWVKASVTPIVKDVSPDNDRVDPGYGYQWWVTSYGEGKPTIFAGNGYGGQFVMVAPEYDIVVVFNGWNLHRSGEKSTYGVLEKVILPSLK